MQQRNSTFSYHSEVVSTWRGLIDSVGTEQFRDRLMTTLELRIGIEHYAAFSLATDKVRVLATDAALAGEQSAAALIAAASTCILSTSDADVVEGEGGAVLQPFSPARLFAEAPGEDKFQPPLADGVFVSLERCGQAFGLALMRGGRHGQFTQDDIENVLSVSGTCLSLIAKHESMLSNACREDRGRALLGSVDQIESTLKIHIPALTKRESQVCARILRGLSTPGIAIDLGVREDSVATYRKRAYQRLAIGSRFELIQLFVGTPALSV